MKAYIFVIASILAGASAMADSQYCSQQAEPSRLDPFLRRQIPVRASPMVGQFTNYTPGASYNSMQGVCGASSRARSNGINPCAFRFEDHFNGKVPVVVSAVPQNGNSCTARRCYGNAKARNNQSTHDLFGGLYRLTPIENQREVGKCVVAAVADRYGRSSNGMSKMDIITYPKSKFQNAINRSSGTIQPVGTLEEFRNANRELLRNSCATGLNPGVRSEACMAFVKARGR